MSLLFKLNLDIDVLQMYFFYFIINDKCGKVCNKLSNCQINPSQTPINPHKIFLVNLPAILMNLRC